MNLRNMDRKTLSVYITEAMRKELEKGSKTIGISLSGFTRMCIATGLRSLEKSEIMSNLASSPHGYSVDKEKASKEKA